MGLEAVYPKPKTSRPHPAQKVYPYLLRNLKIDHPNQVWATDITYIPMCHGFMYLVAITDWHSRKDLSFRFSNTLCRFFMLKPLKRHCSGMGSLTYSTQIRALSLPARRSPICSKIMPCTSAWTVAAGSRIIFSLSGYGGRSNIRTFTFGPMTMERS